MAFVAIANPCGATSYSTTTATKSQIQQQLVLEDADCLQLRSRWTVNINSLQCTVLQNPFREDSYLATPSEQTHISGGNRASHLGDARNHWLQMRTSRICYTASCMCYTATVETEHVSPDAATDKR